MTVLLPVCISLAALGLVLAIVLWVRGRRGRALQAVGFAALPVGLYLTGLLGLVIDAIAALGGWAAGLVFNPVVWAGVVLLGIAVVLWVIGGLIARRTRGRRPAGKGAAGTDVRGRDKDTSPPLTRGNRGTGRTSGSGGSSASGDGEFDDIEELLRRRGIE